MISHDLRRIALLVSWLATSSAFYLFSDRASAEEQDWTCSAFDELCEQIVPAGDPSGFEYLWRLTRGGSWAGGCTYPLGGNVEGIATQCRPEPFEELRAKTFVRQNGKVAIGLAVENRSAEPVTVKLPMTGPVTFAPLRVGRNEEGWGTFEVGGDFGQVCEPSGSSAEATTELAPGERRIVFATLDTTRADCAEMDLKLAQSRVPVCLHFRSERIRVFQFLKSDRIEAGPARTCVRPDVAGCPTFDELCERLSPLGHEPKPRDLLHNFRQESAVNDCTFAIGGTREIEHVCGPDSPVVFVAKAFVREHGKVAIGLALKNVSKEETVVVHDVPFDLLSFTQLRVDRDEGGLTQFDVGQPQSTGCGPPLPQVMEPLTQLGTGQEQIIFATLDVRDPDCAATGLREPTGPMLVCLHFQTLVRRDAGDFDGRLTTPKPGPDKRSCTIVDADDNTPRLVDRTARTTPFLSPPPETAPDDVPRSGGSGEAQDGSEPATDADGAPADREPRDAAPDDPAASPLS